MFSPLLLFSQIRSFSELFPSCTQEQRNAAFSDKYIYYGHRAEGLSIFPYTQGNIRISKSSLGQKPDFFVEALKVIPRSNTSLLSIYNALGRIQNLKGRMYYSEASRKNIPLFTDARRIEGPNKQKVFLSDPPFGVFVPERETFYVRLTDTRFGHCFFEVSLLSNREGILYKVINFKTVSYGPIPVMKENTFTALLYIEPVKEGLALYCLAGAEVSDFIAKFVDIRSALIKRLDVFAGWMLDGLN